MIPLALSLKFAFFFFFVLSWKHFPFIRHTFYDFPDVVTPIYSVYLIVSHKQVMVLVVIVDACLFVVGLHRGSCLGHIHIA
jgi:hypothetical protein